MTNRNLLKEAIADAKAVKETAIANAKAALEEAFTPHLKSMLAKKLEEMDQEDDDVEEAMKSKEKEDMMEEFEVNEFEENIEEEFDLNEILAELEGDEDMTEEVESSEDEMEDEMDDAEVDLEDMSEADLKSFIEDVIADMVASGELEAGEDFEDEMGEEEMEMGDEEVEITESDISEAIDPQTLEMLAAALGPLVIGGGAFALDKAMKALKSGKAGKVGQALANQLEKAGSAAGSTLRRDGKSINESDISEAIDPQTLEMLAAALGPLVIGGGAFALDKAMKALKSGKAGKVGQALANQLEKAGSAAGSTLRRDGKAINEMEEINKLKKELQEVNLLNAKLLYTNKIFKSKNLSEDQKIKVLKSFDKAESVKEAKIIFETLNEGITTPSKSPMMGIKGSASRPSGVIKESKQPVMEVDPQVARWQKIAGIIK